VSSHVFTCGTYQYDGLLPSNPVDKTASATNSSTTAFTSGSAPYNWTNELLLGIFDWTSSVPVFGAGSGYTLRGAATASTTLGFAVEDQAVTTSGSYAATGTLTGASSGGGIILTFKTPASVPPAQGCKNVWSM
jgi:hypothetical protein